MKINFSAAIVKYSDYFVKSDNVFTTLKEGTITKPLNIPPLLTQKMKFFHRGNTKNYGSEIFTNIRILHTEKINDIIEDLKHKL